MVYSLVVANSSCNVIWALVSLLKLVCHQGDIVTAFLHALIGDQIVYVQQPPGYAQKPTSGKRLACRLRKALYGLWQSPLLWYGRAVEWAQQHGFHLLTYDICILKGPRPYTFIVFYMDDFLFLAPTEEEV